MYLNLFCMWTIIGVLKLVNGSDITGFSNSSGEYFIISDSKYDTFQFDTVKCSNNNDNCYVICDVYNGCYNTQIYSQTVSNLHLQCLSERACDSVQIVSPNSNLYLKCDQTSSCNALKINGSKINNNISIQCNSTSSCYQMHISTQKSNELLLKCNGTNACYGITLNVNETSVANIECFGSTSCKNAEFNLANTSNINLQCNYSSLQKWYTIENASCYSTTLNTYTASSNKINIHCNEYNCYHNNFNFHAYNLEHMHVQTSAAYIVFYGYSRYNSINVDNAHVQLSDLTVYCYNDLSCYDATIHTPAASNISRYTINCTTTNACVGANITPLLNIEVVCFDTNNNSYSTLNYNATSGKYQCGTVPGYTCCPFDSAPLNICKKGEDCIIDCALNTSSGTCQQSVIDGTKSTSLILNCNTLHNQGYGCQYSTIKCPLNNHTSCYIKCNEPGSCQDAAIHVSGHHLNEINVECSGDKSCHDFNYYASHVQFLQFNGVSSIKTLSINCLGFQSCYYLPLVTNNASISEFSFNCLDHQSCYSSNIQVKVNKVVNINCKAEQSCAQSTMNIDGLAKGFVQIDCMNQGISSNSYGYSSDGACQDANIQISELASYLQTSNVSINCNPYDCDATFDIQNGGNIVNMGCDVPNACYYSKIYAANAQLLNMVCSDDRSCYNSQVRCPYSNANSCSIACSSSESCYNLDIHVPNDYSYGYLNLSCIDPNCAEMDFYCDVNYNDGSSGITKSTTSYSYNHTCNTDSPLSCCPWPGNAINCDANEECIIECSKQNCAHQLINATTASSLTISCNGDNGCTSTYLLCPTNRNCTIKCNDSLVCQSLMVVNNDKNHKSNINLQCTSYDACAQASIYSPYSNNINLTCSNSGACQNIFVDASNAFDVNIECISPSSCRYMTVNASFAKHISLNASGDRAFDSSHLYAYYSDVIAITCSSYKYDMYDSSYACHDGVFYVNETGLTLNCYGYGCYYLGELHIMNSDISSANIFINGCEQCYSAYNCVNNWKIYCDERDSITFYGDYCSISYYCGCDAEATNIKNNFVNNNSHSLCPGLAPTPYPTPYPTYPTYPSYPSYPSYPTHYPTYPDPSYPSNQHSSTSPGKIIMIVVVVVILLIAVFAFFRAISKKKYNVKKRGREGRKNKNNKNNKQQKRERSQVEGVNDYEFIIQSQEGMDQPMLNEQDINYIQIADQ